MKTEPTSAQKQVIRCEDFNSLSFDKDTQVVNTTMSSKR